MHGNVERSMSVLAVVIALSGCHGNSGSPCAVSDDCWNSSEAQGVGRCAPKDVWCDSGRCRARCAEICKLTQEDVNPCPDPAMICTESKNSGAALPFCTDHVIACSTVDDCPLFRPPATTDGAEWECIDAVCRHPGFEYSTD
jgi:hypothetical protein